MSGPRSFDPVVVGNRETDAWVAYYRREWVKFLRASVESVTRAELEGALVDLYSYVYKAEATAVRPAAQSRVKAMDLSDQWVATGCGLDDPLLVEERRALVASYAALRQAIS